MASKYHITGERFINPYNFVSIDETVLRSAAKAGELSGTIRCELETLAPIFVPNTTRDDTFGTTCQHNSYDFFSYEDLSQRNDYQQNPARPIIPGSSIRGVIRSAYEAVTNSCMSTCDDENTLYRRTPVPRKSVGIIEQDETTGERVLYEASKYKLPVNSRGEHKTGETINGGIYLRGEDFSGKKNDAIMKHALNTNGEKVEITRFNEDSREWVNLVLVWQLYQQKQGKIKGVNQTVTHEGYNGYLSAEKIPVYYAKLDDGDFYYIAPAAITKEVFSRTLSELLEHQGGHSPCQKCDSLCPACNLFGMVGDDAQASRLFFCDATPVAPSDKENWSDWYDKVRALPILSSPKVTATEFYMVDVDGAAYFNYDYFVNYYEYRDKDGKPASAPVRSHLADPKLRGRKFYWHRQSVVFDDTQRFGKQRMEIRPVRTGKTFSFEVGFDRLTKTELETLLWVLTFGENNATHAHKLGHGKPYGYGSVRISKAAVSLVSFCDDLTLCQENSSNFMPQKPLDSDALREYLKLTNFSEASDKVKYPEGDKQSGANPRGVYQWFGINKEIRMGGFKPSFNYVLPKPLDQDIELPGYAAGSGELKENRSPIQAADKPEKDFADIMLKHHADVSAKQPKSAKPEKVQTMTTSIGAISKQTEVKNAAKEALQYGTYTAADIKYWLTFSKEIGKAKNLRSFVEDFERAQRENNKCYSGLAHLYVNAKEKVDAWKKVSS
jgi:CRISPR/Cas system CSM-associated protein Csm3 (group 7 of RAMP superfamily)